MDRMAARRQFFSELRPDNPAAAVGGIYRDTNVHYEGELSTKLSVKIVEAGDPRYRLPLSQLDSPSERGGK